MPDQKLEEGLSPRTINALNYAGIYTYKDVLQYTKAALLKTDGIGWKAIKEVQDVLAKKGLSLPDVPPPKVADRPNLRDYFAAHVISGIFGGKWGQIPNQKPEVAFADIAYLVADEMIKRRNHGPHH